MLRLLCQQVGWGWSEGPVALPRGPKHIVDGSEGQVPGPRGVGDAFGSGR